MSEAVENEHTEPQTEKPNAEPFVKPEEEHAKAQIDGNLKIKNPKVEPVKIHGTEKPDEDEFWPLSGKPYFHLIISKSHIRPQYQLYIPAKLYQVLPSSDIPVVLHYCGRTWNLVYLGDRARKRFDLSWKDFAVDNDLKVGDACVFELAECCSTKLIFKVQILRGDFPAELLAKANGQTPETPIPLD